MARGRRSACWRPSRAASAIVIHGDYDVDGITSTVILRAGLEVLGGDVVPLHPGADARRLRPAARRRSSGCTPRASRLIVSVDCGIRSVDAARRAARTRRRPDHHRPPRAGRRAAARAGRHQPEAPRLPVSGQEPGRRRRRAQAGAGAVRPDRPRELAAGVREDRRHRHAGRRRAAASARTASSRRSASTCSRAARTRSACGRCSTRRASAGKTIDSYHVVVHPGAPRERGRPDGARPTSPRGCCWPPTRRWPTRRGALAAQLNDENLRRQAAGAGHPGRGAPGHRERPGRRRARRCWWSPGDGWHRGVIGIVASKLVDAFHRPAIVISVEDGVGARVLPQHPGVRHAGARSRPARPPAVRFGGHRMAAGLTLDAGAHQAVPRGAAGATATTGSAPTTSGRGCASTPGSASTPSRGGWSRRSRRWRRSASATRGRCSAPARWKSSTARAGSRSGI